MSLLRYIFIASLLILASCGNPIAGNQSVIDEGHRPGVSDADATELIRTSSFVSASVQKQRTLGARFIVEGSMSDGPKEISQTTARGYKIYSTVQGNFISTNSN